LRRPRRVAVAALCALALLAPLPALASTPPRTVPDPGQIAAYRKLYAVTQGAYAANLLPKTTVVAAQKLADGALPADASSIQAYRQAFWLMVGTDLNVPIATIQLRMQTGASLHSLATNKSWPVLRTDVRDWAAYELGLRVLPDPITRKSALALKAYYRIRTRVYAAVDVLLNSHVAKPRPTPSPKPTKTPKPTPSPKPTKTPRPTPSPRPSKSPKAVISVTGAISGA